MADNTYVISEVVGTSPDSLHQAIRNLDWFEVSSIRGHIVDGAEVGHFQVTMKLGFRLD